MGLEKGRELNPAGRWFLTGTLDDNGGKIRFKRSGAYELTGHGYGDNTGRSFIYAALLRLSRYHRVHGTDKETHTDCTVMASVKLTNAGTLSVSPEYEQKQYFDYR